MLPATLGFIRSDRRESCKVVAVAPKSLQRKLEREGIFTHLQQENMRDDKINQL